MMPAPMARQADTTERSYSEIGYFFRSQVSNLRVMLLSSGYQQIRIIYRDDGKTEIHASGGPALKVVNP
ncbi:MAG: hypothetical protein KDI44_19475 [Thiothrix sp.]|nr:hypothetical protein [Thiothrix sp.]HPQ96638.1 hypothetical protein [Thiolinea sp.]